MVEKDSVICLSGDDWTFKEFIGEDWIWRNAEKGDTNDTRFWKKGSVPGSVHNDLWNLGEIPDPYFEKNSLLIEWIPERTWIYKKRFFLDGSYNGYRARLFFKGVDYEAEFFLNDQSIGSHRGMFTPAIFDVASILRYGEYNTIAVVIHPAPIEEPQVGKSSRVRTDKSRMTYWWDFCPRMIHMGIWDDVFLEMTRHFRVEDIFVRPILNDDLNQANIEVDIYISSNKSDESKIELSVMQNNEIIESKYIRCHLKAGANRIKDNIIIYNPSLWWPNGNGEQPLYELKIRVLDQKTGIASHNKNVVFGIRKIDIVKNEQADSSARGYTFVVNGKKHI